MILYALVEYQINNFYIHYLRYKPEYSVTATPKNETLSL